MTDVFINGYEGSEKFSQGDHESCYVKDLCPEITDQQLEMVLQSELFREGLQNMVAESVSAGLSYGGKVVGPVIPVGDIHGVDTLNYTKGEKIARGKLAACYRLADINGWSQGVGAYLSARLLGDNSVLLAPNGLTYDEVTASSLVKVNVNTEVLDNGSTTLGVDRGAAALHIAAYSANQDLTCLIHITSLPAVSVSTMKCGLLPLCQEAMAVGEIGYADLSVDESSVQSAFASHSVRVVFIRSYGVLVAGDSVEEAFVTSLNVMTAIATQMSLVPFGLNNVHLPSSEIRSEAYNEAHQLPIGVRATRQWRYGEVEFEALMRQLDNAGYRTGHIYGDQATSYRQNRSCSEADVTTKKLSIANDSKDLNSLNLTVHRKGALAAEWVGSPNVYHREEVGLQNESSRITRWISETTGEQWVSESGKPIRSSSSVKVSNPNRFAPQGSNPNELRQKVKEIRKEYFDDTITAGPQSTVLEGVTWEEAQMIKDGQSVIGGIDNIRVTAASRGIIQREHQRDALFYKNYSPMNPFERITKDDLDAYKREVEKKSKRGYGKGAGGYTSAESDSEYVPDNRPMSAPLLDHGSFSLPPQPAFSPGKGQYSKTLASPQAIDDDVFRDMPRSSTMPVPKHDTDLEQVLEAMEAATVSASTTDVPVSPVVVSPVAVQPAAASSGEEHFPQRTQSARYPPEKRPELKDEFRRNVKSSKSMRQPDKNVSDNAGVSSRDGSEAGTLTKDKKKKRGFRLPSFSKKKDKQ